MSTRPRRSMRWRLEIPTDELEGTVNATIQPLVTKFEGQGDVGRNVDENYRFVIGFDLHAIGKFEIRDAILDLPNRSRAVVSNGDSQTMSCLHGRKHANRPVFVRMNVILRFNVVEPTVHDLKQSLRTLVGRRAFRNRDQ